MAVNVEARPLDRRQRRRQETIEEVLDVAAAIMDEQGVAGLSIGEIARRMGIRPPSLYVYFPSKNALYDALFARGARAVLQVVQAAADSTDFAALPVEQSLLALAEPFVRWAVANRAYSQLLYWRPVPRWTPSPEAFEPAVQLIADSTERLVALQQLGKLRSDVPPEQLVRDWTVLISGVISQQLSNQPEASFEDGRFTGALRGLVAMFVRHYAVTQPPASPRGKSHGNAR